MIEEQWRPVPGFPGYSVSNLGSLVGPRGKAIRIGNPNTLGFRQFAITRNGVKMIFCLQKVMAEAFIGPCPPDHIIQFDRTQPLTIFALSYVPYVAPPRHVQRTREEYLAEERVSPPIVRAIRSRYVKGNRGGPNSSHALAEEFGISRQNVFRIVRRECYVGPQYEPKPPVPPCEILISGRTP